MESTLKAKAAILRAVDGPYVIEDVELTSPGPTQVLVRIVGAGMCHTDIMPRGEESPCPPPIVTGHEGSGVVEAVGDDVTTIAVGDHVVLTFDSCGLCKNCLRGEPTYCDQFIFRNLLGRSVDGSVGMTDADGNPVGSRWFGQSSFATHAVTEERNTIVVDKSLPLELLGPLGCGIQTGAGSVLVAMDVEAGSSIVVWGSGAVGLAAIMAAKAAGATTIVAVDLQQHRLDLALELGATHAILGGEEDLVAKIGAICEGGSDYAFDTTGVPAVIQSGLAATRMGGVMGLVGIQMGPLVLDGLEPLGKTIMNILEGAVDPKTFIPRMIDLWQEGKFPFDRLIETFPMAEINEAEASSLSGGVIKPVLLP